ncbi:hypothetical protein N9515_00485 [Vicingaceae bacterium]|nr:hypothetical protein [Vicingaceae bacterium]MDB4060416.1 hypothetical protein [Vicingaceae bacterium]
MKKLLFVLGFTCSSFIILGQTGEVFPEIDVFNLNNEAVTIPKDVKGKYSLIGVTFSEDAQQDLYTWSQPVFSEFLDDNNLSNLVYDPHVHLILMFTGANKLAYNISNQQITEGTDEKLAENIVLYKGAMENYRKTLKMEDRKKPYFFVLDKQDKIIYATSGRYTMKALREVGNLIEE